MRIVDFDDRLLPHCALTCPVNAVCDCRPVHRPTGPTLADRIEANASFR